MAKATRILASASLLLLGASADASGARAGVCQAGREDAAMRDHVLLQLGASSTSVADASKLSFAEGPSSQSSSGATVGHGEWCEVAVPGDTLTLKNCSDAEHEVKALTYNLYWWNLFGWQFRDGNDGSAGKLIASAGQDKPYDFMGFQECKGVERVLSDASLAGEYGSVAADHELAIAYRKVAWDLLDHGMQEVAEDRPDEWWGRRGAQWARFRSMSNGYTVLFVNHHGALPVGTGGKCGLRGSAYNILGTITSHVQPGDGVVLVGDFNSNAGTEEVIELESRLHRVYTGTSFGGVDHIFSSCARVVEVRNRGNGGSDHDALDAVIRL